MPAPTLKVFISSPGDVGQERREAVRVLERLQGEFGGAIQLEPILWEHHLLQPTRDFQKQIPEPSTADVMICIFWSRLGTPLPPDYQPREGMPSPSGTEWEFERAYESSRRYNKPLLLVYRKTTKPAYTGDKAEVMAQLEQREALDAFIRRWFHNPDESLKGAFYPFESLDEFADLLIKHLRPLIEKHLRERDPARPVETAEVTWWKGSPYRGLEVFDTEHAAVFAGRTRAIGEIKEILNSRAADHCAFLLIFGMSGCGKSSLVRAGVLPNLMQPGVIEGIGLWRWCIFLPSMAQSGDLLDGLARSLLGPQALPELEESGMSAPELAGLFRDAPQHAVTPLRVALMRAAEAAARQQGRTQPPAARLLVVVDQMEELFTREKVDAEQRERFVTVLSELARSDSAWVIATMRSDFYPRCEEIPALVALKAGGGTYHLLAPSPLEIRQMICDPANAAGLRFERDRDSGLGLDDVLHEAASRNAEALPLLEFTLEELFKRRSEKQELTFAAYRELGGLEGALASRAEAVLTSLPEPVQAELPSLLRSLATIEHAEGNLPTGRRVPLATLAATPACQSLLEAFTKTRLLVTDQADNKQAVIGVAHEALLRHWPRARALLEQDREFLRLRDRVTDAAVIWGKEGKRPDLLLPDGKPLEDAKDMLARRRANLDAELVEYIEVSRNAVAYGRRKRRLAAGTITAAFFAGLVAWGWTSSLQRRSLERQMSVTIETVADLSDVPQKLQSLSGRDGVQVMAAISQAIERTLVRVPDNAIAKRARAVDCLLRAKTLDLEGRFAEALRPAQEAVELGAELVNDRHAPLPAKNQRNLAAFLSTQGDILSDMAFGSMDGRYYVTALEAYKQGRIHAALAASYHGAQWTAWHCDYRAAELQYRMYEGTGDPRQQRLYLEGAAAASRRALALATQAAARDHDVQSQKNLHDSEEIDREVRAAQQAGKQARCAPSSVPACGTG